MWTTIRQSRFRHVETRFPQCQFSHRFRAAPCHGICKRKASVARPSVGKLEPKLLLNTSRRARDYRRSRERDHAAGLQKVAQNAAHSVGRLRISGFRLLGQCPWLLAVDEAVRLAHECPTARSARRGAETCPWRPRGFVLTTNARRSSSSHSACRRVLVEMGNPQPGRIRSTVAEDSWPGRAVGGAAGAVHANVHVASGRRDSRAHVGTPSTHRRGSVSVPGSNTVPAACGIRWPVEK